MLRLLALVTLLAAGSAFADTDADAKAQDAFNKQLGLREGPLTGDMGVAAIAVPAGFVFTDGNGAKKWAQLTTNPVSGKEIGLVGAPDGSLVLFEFDDVGYVKDDEKDDLKADDLLKDIKEGTASFNEERKRAGVPTLDIVGWEQKPVYNQQAHALEWCVRAESQGKPSLNFNTRLLGRRGVVSVTLMFGSEGQTLAQELPAFRELLKGFSFKNGETYSEYKKGDKLAEYGLAALVAGGGVALAAKSGLLSKLGILIAKGGKAVFVAGAAVVGAIAKFFGRIFGRKKA